MLKEKLKKMKMEIIENTDEEILEATILLNNIANNNLTNINSNLQNKFKESISKVHLEYNTPQLIPYGNVPNYFLKKYT